MDGITPFLVCLIPFALLLAVLILPVLERKSRQAGKAKKASQGPAKVKNSRPKKAGIAQAVLNRKERLVLPVLLPEKVKVLEPVKAVHVIVVQETPVPDIQQAPAEPVHDRSDPTRFDFVEF